MAANQRDLIRGVPALKNGFPALLIQAIPANLMDTFCQQCVYAICDTWDRNQLRTSCIHALDDKLLAYDLTRYITWAQTGITVDRVLHECRPVKEKA